MSPSTFVIWLCASTLLILLFSPCINCAKEKPDDKEPSEEKWKKKDIRDYTEADLERLLEQWEVGSVCESEICRLLELLLCTCHLASFYWLAFLGPRELDRFRLILFCQHTTFSNSNVYKNNEIIKYADMEAPIRYHR